MEDLLFETHNLSGSLKEDRKKLMASMKNFVDINALVARCCWKASGGEMEGESFMGEYIELKEGMDKMKDNYMNLLSEKDHLLMMDEMYHSALKKEEEESDRLDNKLEITSDLLKSTRIFLQDSNLKIYQLQKELNVSSLSCCM